MTGKKNGCELRRLKKNIEHRIDGGIWCKVFFCYWKVLEIIFCGVNHVVIDGLCVDFWSGSFLFLGEW